MLAVSGLLRRRGLPVSDAHREDQAEKRAAELLRSCVNDDEWATYSELGFIAVDGADDRYAFLIYPHKPIVAYVPTTGQILGEYCVAFADDTKPYAVSDCRRRTTCSPSGWRSNPMSGSSSRPRTSTHRASRSIRIELPATCGI